MSEAKPKIMVVDDEPEMLFTVTEILEDAGYEVYGAKDGYRAIELASQEAFALVFMDVNLPGIDGVEAFRKIKSISPGTPVIMMTGFSVASLISQALEEANSLRAKLEGSTDICEAMLIDVQRIKDEALIARDEAVLASRKAKLAREDTGRSKARADKSADAAEAAVDLVLEEARSLSAIDDA